MSLTHVKWFPGDAWVVSASKTAGDAFWSPKAGPLAFAQVLSGSGSRRPSNAEMKGSRYGENLMRGLRKLSIASLPLILLNLSSIGQPLAWDEDLN